MNQEEEKRRFLRHAYEHGQWLAPVYAEVLPSPWSFQKVECRDISSSGLAFYLEEKPRYEQCVLALAEPPEMVYLLAEIVDTILERPEGREVYRICCRFKKRLRFDEKMQQLRFPS